MLFVVVFFAGCLEKQNDGNVVDGAKSSNPAPLLTSNSDLASFHVEDVGSTGIACKYRRMVEEV